MKTSITCKRAVDLISKKEEGKITMWQRFQLWRHLGVCSLCRLFSMQNNLIIKNFRHLPVSRATLSAEDKEKMIQAITSEKR